MMKSTMLYHEFLLKNNFGVKAITRQNTSKIKDMSRVMSRRVINRNQMFSTVLLSFQCKYFLLQPLIGGLAGSGACWSDMMSPAPHLKSISPLSLSAVKRARLAMCSDF